jgi:hypothetical protein
MEWIDAEENKTIDRFEDAMECRSFFNHGPVIYFNLDCCTVASQITYMLKGTKRGVLSTGWGMWWDLAVHLFRHFDLPSESGTTSSRHLDVNLPT